MKAIIMNIRNLNKFNSLIERLNHSKLLISNILILRLSSSEIIMFHMHKYSRESAELLLTKQILVISIRITATENSYDDQEYTYAQMNIIQYKFIFYTDLCLLYDTRQLV